MAGGLQGDCVWLPGVAIMGAVAIMRLYSMMACTLCSRLGLRHTGKQYGG